MKRSFLFSLLFLAILAPSFAPKMKLTDEDRRRKVSQEILDNLLKEKYEDVRKDFHISLKQVLPAEKISEVWTQIMATNGEFVKVVSVTAATDKGYNQIKMRLQFKNDNATQETTFNEEDKVVGMFIKP